MKTVTVGVGHVFVAAALLWPSLSLGAEGVDIEAEVKKHKNDPVACGCSLQDDIDLNNRIKMVNMILGEFASAKRKYAGSKQKLTSDIRSAVQRPIVKRINDEKDQKATDVGATTYDFGCFTIINSSATPCLRGALDDHEAVHRAACDAHSLGWRFDQSVEDWIQEEIDAYEAELKRLNEERNKRLPFCTLDPTVKSILWKNAADKEREKEAKEFLDWVAGFF